MTVWYLFERYSHKMNAQVTKISYPQVIHYAQAAIFMPELSTGYTLI